MHQQLLDAYHKNRWAIQHFKHPWLFIASWYCERVFENALKLTGLYQRGYRNALDLRVHHREFILPRLPRALDGIRVLFLSDLHLGVVEELPDIIVDKLKGVEADLCLLGGDFRFSLLLPHLPFLDEMRKVVAAIRAPMGIYGVLGNHDEVEMAPELEQIGIKILVNAGTRIEKNGGRLYLAGVDNPLSETRHDIELAVAGRDSGECTILLAHAPDLYREAREMGIDLYLCGHTHHGQIRLPLFGPLLTATTAPRNLSEGHWHYETMQGYTAAGVGTGIVSVRYLCPPEITVMTLRAQ